MLMTSVTCAEQILSHHSPKQSDETFFIPFRVLGMKYLENIRKPVKLEPGCPAPLICISLWVV